MVLNVLARSQMPLASAESIRNLRHLTHLLRSQQSARNFGPNHLHALLALAVNTAAQPEGSELVVGQLAREELIGLTPEQFDVFPNCRIVLLLSELAVGHNISDCHMVSFPIENIIFPGFIQGVPSRAKPPGATMIRPWWDPGPHSGSSREA